MCHVVIFTGTKNVYLIDTTYINDRENIYCKSSMCGTLASSNFGSAESFSESSSSSSLSSLSLSSSSDCPVWLSSFSFGLVLLSGYNWMKRGVVDWTYSFVLGVVASPGRDWDGTKRELAGTILPPPNIFPNREFSPWKRAPNRLLSKLSGFWSWFPPNTRWFGFCTRVWMTRTGFCLDCCGGWILWLKGNPGPKSGWNWNLGCWIWGAKIGWNGTKIGSGSATGVAKVAGSRRRYTECIFCAYILRLII